MTTADSLPLWKRPLINLGDIALTVIRELGAWTIFGVKSVGVMLLFPWEIRKTVEQIYMIGVKCLPVICLVGLFTGMVLGLQGYYTLAKIGSEGLLGTAVALSLIRELGPVLASVMIIGQAGSAMAAEIGIMRNSEQIDALQTMHIDPLRFLVGPKMVAAILCFPLLASIFDVIGIFGGYVSGVILLGLDSGVYWSRVESGVDWVDVKGGFCKAFAFGWLSACICCYQGYWVHTRTEGFGAKGVSLAATSAVVLSCVTVLVVDYVLTSFLL